MVHDLAWRKCSSFSLYPQKFGCTPKNEGKRVHVPPDEKTCGHAEFHEVLFSSFRAVALTNCVTDRRTGQKQCLPTKVGGDIIVMPYTYAQ